ncbi:hypothetical protein CDL12_23211 [Handroanthus impetiginosus]|uniref:Cystatin domain-containing protein n=1 Tax=Handroanthus impetiginosus TaxID=429701 RepID=A0A2G9GG38_9LAMI|nr:hypothetical protein CDL12_23211 [Handroanthus impetiginosus]
MAFRKCPPPVFIILCLLVNQYSTASATTDGQNLLHFSRWRPIADLKDPKVLEISGFAVSEHNKLAKTNLKLQSVINGNMRVLGGRNYRLVISAVDGDVQNNYLALVYEKTWQHFKILTSFRKIATLA